MWRHVWVSAGWPAGRVSLAQKGGQAALAPQANIFVTIKKFGAMSVVCTGNVLSSGVCDISYQESYLGKLPHESLAASKIHPVTAGKQKDKTFNFHLWAL